MNDVGIRSLPKVAAGADRPGLFTFLRAMVANPVAAIPASAYEDDLVVMDLPGPPVAFVTDPALLEEIMIKRVADFPKSQIDEQMLRPAFGDSLLTAHGESWRWKRRLAAPYFSPTALARFLPDMVAPFQELAEAWRQGGAPRTTDVTPAMTAATFEVISRVLFLRRDEIDFSAISEAINTYLAPISWSIGYATLKLPRWLPHPGYFEIRRACRRMRAIVGALVAARRRAGDRPPDICGDLMAAEDPETGRPLSDEDLVDMLLTLVAAGHETSANGLTWALYCLAERPAEQRALAAEIADVVGDRPVEAADLPQLVKVEAFLKETMRLFPPVPFLARRSLRPETFGGHALAAGATLFIPIYAIHRHRRLWTEPDAFDPDRFFGEQAKAIARTAYMPFGAGPRICIGATFAMMEMVAGLATMLRYVQFELADDAFPRPLARITLRPKGGIELRIAPAVS